MGGIRELPAHKKEIRKGQKTKSVSLDDKLVIPYALDPFTQTRPR